MSAESNASLTNEIVVALADLSASEALQQLRELDLDNAETILSLATRALQEAETEPELSEHWIAICRAGNHAIRSAAVDAQLAYVQARLDLQRGDIDSAERNILEAQGQWQAVGDSASIARSNLGLTQILAMQGRYDEAENAIQQAIAYFEQAVQGDDHPPNLADASSIFRLIGARRNLANLYSYQDLHNAALAEFSKVNAIIDQAQSLLDNKSEAYHAFQYERAHLAISASLSLSHLDQIGEAESTLLDAISIFESDNDRTHQGHIYSNLGSLYLRMGRYADALAVFEQSAEFLAPKEDANVDVDEAQLFASSPMLLEQATAYIALNLLPEAENLLRRCESTYRDAGMASSKNEPSSIPRELARTLYALGQLYARTGELQQAQSAIAEAQEIFESIGNKYWLNRCQFAMAMMAYLQNDTTTCIMLLDNLMAGSGTDTQALSDLGTTEWDLGLLTDSRLLRLRIHVDAGEITSAQKLASQIDSSIATTTEFRHLHLRLLHAKGLIAQKSGHHDEARNLFLQAIELLERQRSTLLVEEIRSAFIIDKTDIYTDLVLNLLSIIDTQKSANDTSSTHGDELVAEAFSIIERARSRTLLERLLATLPSESGDAADAEIDDGSGQQLPRHESLRRELHWLYNRLLGQDGTRRMDVALTQQIQACEDELQKLEWQISPTLQQADPVALDSLQEILAADQQAIAYYIANDEVMAFVASATEVEFVRKICTKNELLSALRDFRFQLGRFQVGQQYVERHTKRLQRGIDDCLHKLYNLLLNPLAQYLTAQRLLIIPFGAAHLVPFHALRNDTGYLVEHFECSYAPSASIAVACQENASSSRSFSSVAAFGITDELIPQARLEVESITKYFEKAELYLDEHANRQNLNRTSSEVDVLHIATHGLYRSDNPFFSSLKLADGWIDVREIYRLPLRARLVVLSACESGSGYVQDGDEVIGLARGFLGAGAHSLIVSMWNLHDETAAQQMSRFYDALMNDDLMNKDECIKPVSALRKAQLDAIAQGQHPYYWAPFAVIG